MFNLANDPVAEHLSQRIAGYLLSSALTSCSEWSRNRRVMGGDFPGPYSWRFHPWVRDMLDSKASFNYAMKGAQLGVTEAGINRAFYVLDQLKRDVLYILPTATVASDFSKARFSSALKLSPYLDKMFIDTNTVNLKRTEYCSLYIRGSRGESNLVSIPVSELIIDELDLMDQRAIELAQERLSGQKRKVVFAISTPTIHERGIHKFYLSGTQEVFTFKCPYCSKFITLTWPDSFVVVGEAANDPRCDESYIVCKECKHRLEHEEKPLFLAEAQWIATTNQPNFDCRSWNLGQLYSYTETPGRIARAYFRSLTDECAATEFHNSKMGIPFIAETAQVKDDEINAAIGPYRMEMVNRPRRGESRKIYTLGIDQGLLNHWVVCEWLIDEMCADINMSAFCKICAFGSFPGENLERDAGDLMLEWQILSCVIDADPSINEARRFARSYPGFVYLCRYRKGKSPKEVTISDEKTSAPIITVDRTSWLGASLGRFKRKRIQVPQDINMEFRNHMRALVRTWRRDDLNNPEAIYVNQGPDHYAHALTYNELALPFACSTQSGSNVERFL